MSNGLSRRSRRPVTRRRLKSWEVGPGRSITQTQITGSTALLATSGSALLQDGLTLLRLRGELTLQIATVSAIGSGYSGAVGIGIVTLDAFTAGVASVPQPVADEEWDGWIWWHPFSVKSITATIGDGVNAAAVQQRIPMDTKAMRKLRENDVIFFMIETTEVGVALLDWHVDSRILLALP